MKQIIVILWLSFSVLSSCTSKTRDNVQVLIKTEKSDSLLLVKEYYFDPEKNAKLEIFKNEVDNYILLQTKQYDRIVSICGEGNTDFVVNDDNSIKFDSLYFEKDEKVYLLQTYVWGSTYGAVVYYLIFEGNYQYALEIYKIPFDRVEIETDKNNLSKIVHYTHDNRTLKYIFKDGILQQVR